MADELSIVLLSLAEYFNYFAVVLILLCSVLMTVFIIRHGEHLRLYRGAPGQGTSSLAFQRPVTEFCNPFFLRLSTDGMNVELSCLEASDVCVLWGAAINPVHAALLQTGTTFVDDLTHGSLLREDSLMLEKLRLGTPGKHKLRLPVPPEFELKSLGPPPRQRYPCVVVMTAADGLTLDAEENRVVALVTVVHVKDDQCRMNTHIMAQYAKLAGKAVYNLQPLFFASEFDTDTGSPASRPLQTHNSQENTDSPRLADLTPGSGGVQPPADISSGRGVDEGIKRGKNSGAESADCRGFDSHIGDLPCDRKTHTGGCVAAQRDSDEFESASQTATVLENIAYAEVLDTPCDDPETGASVHGYGHTSVEGCVQAELRNKLMHPQIDTITQLNAKTDKREGQGDVTWLPSNASGNGSDLSLSDSLISLGENCEAFPDSSSPSTSISDAGKTLPDCIVCQSQRLTCVLLPCRHACVCRSCFTQLDRCPMCRSIIESFFTLTDVDEAEDESGEEIYEGPHGWGARWDMLNQRLNNFFGFT